MKLRILAADDEELMRNLYRRLFCAEKYDLTLAATVREGLEFLNSMPYDMLISDLNFPDGTGLELVRWFSASGPGRSVLVTGALSGAELKKVKDEHGLIGCFPKPFETDNLLRLVEKCGA